eukprot:15344125-Ditylum_brightwellii.AAC.1
MLGMTKSRFNFIWRHFNVQSNTATYQEGASDSEDNTDDDEEGEEYLVEQTAERVQTEKEERNRDDLSVDSNSSDKEDADSDSDGKKGKVEEHPRKKEV